MKMARAIVVVGVVAQGFLACGSPSSPSASPPRVQQPAPAPQPFQVTGHALDTAGRTLAGVAVEVLDGPQTGTRTTSDPAGVFSMTGVFDGATRFRASKDGYLTATYAFPSIATTKRLGFGLGLLAPPVNIAGDYTVTFIADSTCTGLPDELRTRSYPATVTAQLLPYEAANSQFAALLSGPGLDAYYHQIGIGVAGDYLTFDLSDNYVLDEVAEEAYLAFGGYGHASVTASDFSTISGTLDGTIDYCVARSDIDGARYQCPSDAVTHLQCRSSQQRLILTRR